MPIKFSGETKRPATSGSGPAKGPAKGTPPAPPAPPADALFAQPLLTGSYSTKGQVQSHSIADRNATYQFQEQFKGNPAGLQTAYREALNDIPHPVTGQPTSYGALQDELRNNKRALLDSPTYQQGNYKSSDDYLQQTFDSAKQRLLQRAVKDPQRNAFAPAEQALSQERLQRGIAFEPVGAYDPADGRSATNAYADFLYKRSSDGTGLHAAPGMGGAARRKSK